MRTTITSYFFVVENSELQGLLLDLYANICSNQIHTYSTYIGFIAYSQPSEKRAKIFSFGLQHYFVPCFLNYVPSRDCPLKMYLLQGLVSIAADYTKEEEEVEFAR
jgi:hypothetical protein